MLDWKVNLKTVTLRISGNNQSYSNHIWMKTWNKLITVSNASECDFICVDPEDNIVLQSIIYLIV